MKKKILVAIGMVMMIGCMTACGTAKEDTAAQTTEASETEGTGNEVYSTDDYSISYSADSFEVNDVRGTVQFNYCNSDVQAAGSNQILITKDEGTTVDDVMSGIVGSDSMDNVSDGTLGADMIPVKSYVRTSESPADAALTLVDQFMVMQSGDNVITLEIIQTVGQAEEIDMTVQGAFTYTLESFVLK